MTKEVGDGLAKRTKIFKLESTRPRVLDLCMAPGGFAATAHKHLSGVLIDAVTLPSEIGGLEVMDKNVCQNIEYADITMYAEEMGFGKPVPPDHPDYTNFKMTRPFLDNRYDIVICGGAVGKSHQLEEYRRAHERLRLTVSQLVFAMNRLKPGGSIVLLLHRVESWQTVCILNIFNQVSDIQLYKPPRIHAVKSSFYLVARNVNLEHALVKTSISYWKDLWEYLTFREFKDIPYPTSALYNPGEDFAEIVRKGFGPRFIKLARPVWRFQADALRKASFTQINQK